MGRRNYPNASELGLGETNKKRFAAKTVFFMITCEA